MRYKLVVSCPRGLEEILKQELIEISSSQNIFLGKGMVEVNDALLEDIYKINLYSRTASRVLLFLNKFNVSNEKSLYQAALNIVWDDWFDFKKTFRVKIQGKCSWNKNIDFLALKIKDSICDFFRAKYDQRPNVNKINPDVRISAYLDERQLFFYLDTSGEALFKRGWRQYKSIAPIRENLAAGLLLLSDYRGNQPFLDPMCGSGTIAIEAAMIAANIPPGLRRSFSFENFKNFDKKLWHELKLNSSNSIKKEVPYPIMAYDIAPKMISIAQKNASFADVVHLIEFKQINFTDIKTIPDQGLLVSNPPYGERMDQKEKLYLIYPLWGTVLKKQFAGWTACFISAELKLFNLFSLLPRKKIIVYNGKIECRYFIFDMVKGSNR